jgi:hypothetical protein
MWCHNDIAKIDRTLDQLKVHLRRERSAAPNETASEPATSIAPDTCSALRQLSSQPIFKNQNLSRNPALGVFFY